nr:hypothetical protein [uncultured Brevundimonas sp.]
MALAVAALLAAGAANACSPLRKTPEEWDAYFRAEYAKQVGASRSVYWATLEDVSRGSNYPRYTIVAGNVIQGATPPTTLQSPDRLVGSCGPNPCYGIEQIQPNSPAGSKVLVFLGATPGGELEVIDIAAEGASRTDSLLALIQALSVASK